LLSGQQSHRIADQADQRKCANPSKGVPLSRNAVFFAFQPNQKTQEEREEDLEAFRRYEL
jgi:hypothetical protein